MSYREQMTKGRKKTPYFILVYGGPGLGKTTFACNAPKALVINLEGGTDEIDAEFDELPVPTSFKEVIAQIDDILKDPEYKNQTLVIDSLSKLEPYIWDEVCKEGGKASITKFGYGEGYKLALQKWRLLLDKLALVRDQKKWNVVMIAHPEVKDITDPLQLRDYPRWQPRLHKDAWPLIVESVKAVLFADVESYINSADEEKSARVLSEGIRVLRTEFRPSFVAKNRYGLPLTIDLSWQAFDEAAKKGQPDEPSAIIARIEGLCLQISNNDELVATVKVEVEKVKDNAKKLSAYENKLKTIVSKQEGS